MEEILSDLQDSGNTTLQNKGKAKIPGCASCMDYLTRLTDYNSLSLLKKK